MDPCRQVTRAPRRRGGARPAGTGPGKAGAGPGRAISRAAPSAAALAPYRSASLTALAISRSISRLRIDSRLSKRSLPRPRAISTFARGPLK